MRLIRQILIGAIVLSLVLLAISSLLPNEVMTSRWVLIDAEKDTVLKKVRDLNSWNSWILFLQTAEQVDIKKSGNQHDIGSVISWKTENGGLNRITITENNEKGIITETELNNDRSFVSGFSVEKRKVDSVQVVWFIVEKLKWYPWEKFYGIMAGDIKGPYMQRSLERLKLSLE